MLCGCFVASPRPLFCACSCAFWVGEAVLRRWLLIPFPLLSCCAKQNAAQAYAGDARRLGCGVPGALRFHEDAVFVFRQVPLRSVAARLLRPAPSPLRSPSLFSFPSVCVLLRLLPLPLLLPRCYIYSREPVNELPKMRQIGDEGSFRLMGTINQKTSFCNLCFNWLSPPEGR